MGLGFSVLFGSVSERASVKGLGAFFQYIFGLLTGFRNRAYARGLVFFRTSGLGGLGCRVCCGVGFSCSFRALQVSFVGLGVAGFGAPDERALHYG